jgi:hypothetical protein
MSTETKKPKAALTKEATAHMRKAVWRLATTYDETEYVGAVCMPNSLHNAIREAIEAACSAYGCDQWQLGGE